MTSSPSSPSSPSYQDEQTHLLSHTAPLYSTPSSSIPHSSNDAATTTCDSSLPHYDAVNHGHAYTDALLGGMAMEQSTGARPLSPPLPEEARSKKGVTYWSLIRDNRNFRWFLLSYLVTIAGE